MTKKKKNTQSTKKSKAAKSRKSSQSAQATPRPSQSEGQQKTWVVAVRWVIIVLLVLGLVSSLFLGILASAYGVPQQTNSGATSHTLERSAVQGLEQPAQELKQSALLEQAALLEKSALLEQPTLLELQRTASYSVQSGDIIDGSPAENYATVSDDLPSAMAPMVGVCTKDGRILFERAIDTQVPMASTTKMMTAIVALESLPLDTPLTVAYGAANTLGTSADLEEGMTISLLDCLYALLLPSGNDAAVVIAGNISGMEIRFVELMNAKAAELGMTSTLFSDSSGLSEENHYTTVRDYLTLVRYCMSNTTFRQIVATDYYEATVDGKVLSFVTTDALGDYLTEATPIGVKTGYTDEAGYCFVGAATYNGIELYSVVFNAPTTEQRFADTASVLEWGFRHYRTIELINTSQQVADVALLSWIDKTVPAYVPAAVRVEIFDLKGTIAQDITINDIDGEASKGKSCGQIIWSQDGEVLSTSDVIVGETVLAPGFWEGIGIAWQRFWDGFSDIAANAETSILLKSELAIPESQPVAE